MDAKVTYTESDNPQQTKPNEAIHKLWEKTSVRHPIIMIKFAIMQEVLLPRLSASIAITRLPMRVPKKAALE